MTVSTRKPTLMLGSSEAAVAPTSIAGWDVICLAAAVDAASELNPEARELKLQCLPSGRGTTVVTSDHDGVAIATGDAAAVAAAELNPGAKEPELQCLPTGRGTTVVTSGHDGVAIAAGDAAAVE